MSRARLALRPLLSGMLVLLLCQCETARFYRQAVAGHLEVRRAMRPSAEVCAEAATPAKVREQLEVVNELRAYAIARLGLPAQRQYRSYADIGREHLVWVVFAAPEFELRPRTWSYPFLGDLSYRGFFRPEQAEQLAAQLRAEGEDVFVAEVDAYSSLGWFSDPVLNTFIDRTDRELAELLFHELTHQRLYWRGDTDFNEALATAVGRAGTRRWLQETNRTSELAAFEREEVIQSAFLEDLKVIRARLEKLYARSDLTAEAKREEKVAIFQDLRRRADVLNRRFGGSLKIDRWFAKPVNNARLLSIASYHDLVPLFERRLEQGCAGDFAVFFEQLRATRRMRPEERLQWLRGSPSVDAVEALH